MRPSKLIFLPGAAGRSDYWDTVAAALQHPARRCSLGWPGFADVPARDDVQGFDDLVRLVQAEIDQPCALIAQSMGGAVALSAVLQRAPAARAQVTHLVLAVTSGGVDLSGVGAQDWRAAFLAERPRVPRWFTDLRLDVSAQLPELRQACLLIWGDSDPISPVAVGERLQAGLAQARLVVLPGAGHDLVLTHATDVARLIDEHLSFSPHELP
ncbi:alpha/beta hydrolase [Comamonas serinivorans]|uniref:Alpha/beta hydrolase n=1 Tax=Comamonas serinivorans TaxID=1082851 RepID=A0A1Y0EME3_9BURK|nr:alpha/beta fold hydrolase [Comamonas serinivorans]ARU04824.1 alpha/beta hydrolase [Comamonas serinivorans]